MSITLNSSLEKVLLTKCHPVKVELESTKSAIQFTERYLALEFSGNNVIGEDFTIIVDSLTLTIPVVASADSTGNEISVRGAETLNTYRDNVINELLNNYYICLYFTLSSFTGAHGESSIKFIPRDINVTMSISEAMTDTTAELVETANGDYEENFSIALIVEHLDTSDNVTDQFEHLLPVLDDDTVEFDIQKDFSLSYERPMEDALTTSTTYHGICTKPIQKFQMKWAEYYGNPATFQGLADNSTIYFALYGGRSWLNRNESWYTAFLAAEKFLTYQSRSKEVTFDQPEFLYFFLDASTNRDLELFISYTLQNDTFGTETKSLGTVSANSLIWLKVGLEYLNITVPPSNPIKSYEIRVRDVTGTTTDISETFSFTVTLDQTDYSRFFLFGNSLGGCDVVRGTGKVKSMATYSKTESLQDAESDDQVGGVLVLNKRQQSTYSGSLGFKDEFYIKQLQELLLSDQVWEIDIENGEYIPLVVDTSSVELFQDDDDLYKMRWEYRHAFFECALEF